jgi:flavin reductase (DIM6/NTAB) family NADH-FMN oxidoreductase RutF
MDTDRKRDLGRALGQIPSGCYVLTACDGERCTGLLTSWVQQAGFDPPAVTVAIKKGRPVEALIEASGSFVLNAVGEPRTAMFKHYGRGFDADEPAFEGLTTTRIDQGVCIDECIGHLACRVMSRADGGDHHIYVAEVLEGQMTPAARPYVHLRANGFGY